MWLLAAGCCCLAGSVCALCCDVFKGCRRFGHLEGPQRQRVLGVSSLPLCSCPAITPCLIPCAALPALLGAAAAAARTPSTSVAQKSELTLLCERFQQQFGHLQVRAERGCSSCRKLPLQSTVQYCSAVALWLL